jgi:hypothetical protein
MREIEDLLESKLKFFEDNPVSVQSVVAYNWILSALT